MNSQEVAQVLAKIQIIDNRQVDRLVVAEWADAIGHLRFEDAVAAVKLHRQESTEYLQPAHVVRGARRVREQRAIAREVYCTSHEWYPVPCDKCAEVPA